MPMSDSAATAPPSQHVSELFDGYEISPTVVTTSLGDRPDDMELPPAHIDSMASFAALAGSPKLADRRRKLSNPEVKAQPAKDARKCRGGVPATIERPQISLGPSAAEVWVRSPNPSPHPHPHPHPSPHPSSHPHPTAHPHPNPNQVWAQSLAEMNAKSPALSAEAPR